MPSVVRSLFFSDIEGSTALLERAGREWATLLSRHRVIVRAAIATYGGREHGTEGDSFFVSFDSPSDAVRAAVAVQHGLQLEPWPDGLQVAVRIGVHIGEVTEHDGGLVGMAVHHAARIASTANGGQVVVSDEVRALASTVEDGVDFVSRGFFRLRDLGVVELHQVCSPSMEPLLAPLRALVFQRSNLPRSFSSLVGRTTEIGQLEDLLRTTPFVSVVGPGGVGKTSVVLDVGRNLIDGLSGGVWFIELGPVTEGDAVDVAVAGELSVPAQPAVDVRTALADHLASRPTLLVLDNCEHVLDACRGLIDHLLRSCPELLVLATSRVPFGMRSERVVRLGPLTDDDDALALFVERATSADSSFSVGPTERQTIVEICRRLDGVPLAIELAAARVRSMSVNDIAVRIDDRFRLLRAGSSDHDLRHQTLHATVEWSYRLLTDAERVVFDRLSVFRGVFDLDAVESVCDDGDLDDDVVDIMQSLVEQSMVVSVRQHGRSCFRLLETMRDFAGVRLADHGEVDRWRTRHLDHLAAAADRHDVASLDPDPSKAWYWFDSTWDDIRGAFRWAVDSGRFDLADHLVVKTAWFAFTHLRSEHLEWAEQLRTLDGTAGQMSTAGCGVLAYWYGSINGEEERSRELATEGLARSSDTTHLDTLYCWTGLPVADAPRPGDLFGPRYAGLLSVVSSMRDPADDWRVLVELIDAAQARGAAGVAEVDSCLTMMRDALARVPAPALRFSYEIASGHTLIGGERSSQREAERHYLAALETARAVGDQRFVGLAMRALAFAAVMQDAPDAFLLCLEAVEVLHETRYLQKLVQTFDSAALVLARCGRYEDAAAIAAYLELAFPEGYGLEAMAGFRDATCRLLDRHLEGWRQQPPLHLTDLVERLLASTGLDTS